MTEKRFVYYEHKGADYILDTPNKSLDFIEMLGDCLEAEEIVDLLNCLNEENEQLKQFKEKVFALIDKEIARNEEAIKWEKETIADSGSIEVYNYMLNRLKKELQEMTETKRFLIDYAGELIDLNNHKFIDYGDECCKLLNDLHDENQELKKKNKQLSICEKRIIELKKENKQLKQHNTELINKIDFLERVIGGDV